MDTPTGSSLIQRASNAGNMVAIVANNVVDKRFGQIKETVTGFARRSKPLKVLGRVFDYKRDSWSMIGKKLLVYGWDNPQRHQIGGRGSAAFLRSYLRYAERAVQVPS